MPIHAMRIGASLRRRDADDLVSRPVAGRQVERPVGALSSGAEAAVRRVKEDVLLSGNRADEREAAQVRFVEGREEERAVVGAPLNTASEVGAACRERDVARGPRWIDKARVATRSAADRVPVVRTRAEDVDLVVRVVAVLDLNDATGPGLEGQALRVPIPHRVHSRPSGSAGHHRVVRRDASVSVHAEDFSVQHVRVLPVRRVSGVAHRDPELAVGAEADPATVVIAVRAHARADHVAIEDRCVAVHPEALHLVEPQAAVIHGHADVEEVVGRERRVELDAHEPGLARRVDVRDREDIGQLRGVWRAARVDEDVPDALGHEHPPIGREGQVPRDREPGSNDRRGQSRNGARRQRHGDGEEDALILHPRRSEEHTSELQSQSNLVCRLLLEKKKEGANVLFCAREGESLARFEQKLKESARAGQRILAQACDVSSASDSEELFRRADDELGALHILINNAGVYGPKGPSEEVAWDEWCRCIEINLYGTLIPCRHAISRFKKSGAGKIINLSGGGATNPLPNISAYAASKAAVVRLTETLAEELRKWHIYVNAIAPGALNTRLLDEVLAAGPDKVGAEFYLRAVKQSQDGGVPLDLGADL